MRTTSFKSLFLYTRSPSFSCTTTTTPPTRDRPIVSIPRLAFCGECHDINVSFPHTDVLPYLWISSSHLFSVPFCLVPSGFMLRLYADFSTLPPSPSLPLPFPFLILFVVFFFRFCFCLCFSPRIYFLFQSLRVFCCHYTHPLNLVVFASFHLLYILSSRYIPGTCFPPTYLFYSFYTILRFVYSYGVI